MTRCRSAIGRAKKASGRSRAKTASVWARAETIRRRCAARNARTSDAAASHKDLIQARYRTWSAARVYCGKVNVPGACTHVQSLEKVTPAKKRECEECIPIGGRWV